MPGRGTSTSRGPGHRRSWYPRPGRQWPTRISGRRSAASSLPAASGPVPRSARASMTCGTRSRCTRWPAGTGRAKTSAPCCPAVDLPGSLRSRLHLLVPVGRAGTAGTGGRPARGSPGGPAVTALAPTLQLFFTERLARQRQASPQTVISYRNTFRLLLGFLQQRTGKAPSHLDWNDLGADTVSAFLDHLENSRGNIARSRNARLAALCSLFRYAALRHPE